MPPAQRDMLGLSRIVMASEAIAESDVVGKRISSEQQWSLAPLHGIMSCCAPGFFAQGTIGRVNFPAWLGRNSTSTKRQRLLRECTSHMQAQISGSKEEVRQSYVPALREALLRPLRDRGADGIPEVLELLDAYGLSKDDFDAIMELQLLAQNAKADISGIASNVKAALTRKYNAAHQGVKKTTSTSKVTVERFTEDGDIDDDDDEEEEEEAPVAAKPATKNARGKAKAPK